MLWTNFSPVVEACQPWVLATDLVVDRLNTSPFGFPIPEELRLNPQHRRNATFVKLVQRLDELTFGPVGMPMPSWVFYDCAVMPAAVFGLASPVETLEPWVRAVLGVEDDYEGHVPLSLFIAIPTLTEGTWFVYTLCDINEIAPGAAPGGLSQLSLVLGLKVLGVETLQGATQWRSRQLPHLCNMGALEVMTAWTPAHSYVRTVTYRTAVDDESLQAVLTTPRSNPALPLPTHMLDVDDVEMLQRVQRDVEEGVFWQIVGRPILRGAHTMVPMRREKDGVASWA